MSRLVLVDARDTSEARSLAGHLASLLRPWRVRASVVVLFVLAAGFIRARAPVHHPDDRRRASDRRAIGRPALARRPLPRGQRRRPGDDVPLRLSRCDVAQGVLSGVRVRLFAHLQRLPGAYFDRTPVGDVISRCTSDVETLDTVFSSGVAVLVANLVRLRDRRRRDGHPQSSPHPRGRSGHSRRWSSSIRFLQVRVRQAERATRIAVGSARPLVSRRACAAPRSFGHSAGNARPSAGFRRVLGRCPGRIEPRHAVLGALHADDRDSVGAGGCRAALGRNATGVRRVRHFHSGRSRRS